MRITKGDKTINIPGWTLFVGALVLDNIVVNACKTISYRNLCKTLEKLETEKKEEES